MPEQLLLLDVPAVPRPRGNWFWALRFAQEPHVSRQLDELSQNLRARHRLTGLPLGADRYHLSLHPLRRHPPAWRDLVEVACTAFATTTPPFPVTFDRVANFGGRYGKSSLVLHNGHEPGTLQIFRYRLGVALTLHGLGPFDFGRFTPHVTLLYDKGPVTEHTVTPISWTVTDFFLVQSLTGESQHVVQGQWSLRG